MVGRELPEGGDQLWIRGELGRLTASCVVNQACSRSRGARSVFQVTASSSWRTGPQPPSDDGLAQRRSCWGSACTPPCGSRRGHGPRRRRWPWPVRVGAAPARWLARIVSVSSAFPWGISARCRAASSVAPRTAARRRPPPGTAFSISANSCSLNSSSAAATASPIRPGRLAPTSATTSPCSPCPGPAPRRRRVRATLVPWASAIGRSLSTIARLASRLPSLKRGRCARVPRRLLGVPVQSR